MNEENINSQEIQQSFRDDISKRGGNLLVYNYFGRISQLKDVEISYDVHGKYRPPKKFKQKEQKEQNNCIIC